MAYCDKAVDSARMLKAPPTTEPAVAPREAAVRPSLPDVFSSVRISQSPKLWRRLLGFIGPGFLISVGYMDPGNWATDLAAGSRYGYTLLFAIMVSNLLAILLQSLSVKLGVATERDLAQACREHYSRPVNIGLWVFAEIAIALQLLFGIPLLLGVLITSLDVLLILFLQHRGFRYLEAVVMVLIGTIGALFAVEILLSHPQWHSIAVHLFLPPPRVLSDSYMLFISISILGATVMPHNLYLHSSIVQTRAYPRTPEGKREAIWLANLDSAAALTLALFVNAAILIVAAAVFHRSGHLEVAEIGDAYKLLTPLLGVTGASTMFAVALLASGQNSTLTGTLAGQVVMEGFLDLRLPAWQRRLLTRLLAIIPTVIVTALWGSSGTSRLLLLSQVVLSMQLSFAVFPLIAFTSDRSKMGQFVNRPWLRILGWSSAIFIAALNGWLLLQVVVLGHS